jgi:hypothetical protein
MTLQTVCLSPVACAERACHHGLYSDQGVRMSLNHLSDHPTYREFAYHCRSDCWREEHFAIPIQLLPELTENYLRVADHSESDKTSPYKRVSRY